MKLKASTDYGIRIVSYLAMNGGICSSKDISKAISVPRDYLIQLAQLLRNSGIVKARSGKNGGYGLAKDPSEITLLEVMNSLDEDPHVEMKHQAESQGGSAPMMDEVKNALDLALRSYEDYLSGVTIGSLLEKARSGSNDLSKFRDAALMDAEECRLSAKEATREAIAVPSPIPVAAL